MYLAMRYLTICLTITCQRQLPSSSFLFDGVVLYWSRHIDRNNIFDDRVAPNGKLTTEFLLPTR